MQTDTLLLVPTGGCVFKNSKGLEMIVIRIFKAARNLTLLQSNNYGTDQSAYPHSPISAFLMHLQMQRDV